MALLLASSSALAGVTVEFRDNDGTPTSEWMRLEFKIVNDQSTSFDLANSTIRYYFRDTNQTWSTELWSFLVNSLPASTSSIVASVAREPTMPEGWVLTLKFSSGTIGANSNAWVLAGVHNQTWNVNETDDYSYMSGPVFQTATNIFLYSSDIRIFPLFEVSPFFTPRSNPFISNVNREHNSSDPVVAQVGSKLYLATSTDQCGVDSCGLPDGEASTDWAMDGVHLYSTSGPNPANVQWLEHGNALLPGGKIQPILSLADYADVHAQQTPKKMFAPDIQYVPGNGKLYFYVPLPTTDKGWQIAMASAVVNSDGSYGLFERSSSLFRFDQASLDSPNFNPMNDPVDPGVFEKVPNPAFPNEHKYLMLYVDASYAQMKDKPASERIGNFSMASLYSDMTTASFQGKVRFAPPYSHYSRLINFMEGPDVTVMTSKSGKKYYYMVFTAGEGSNGQGSNLIGYAMADAESFENSPTYCWNFKGWIFQNLGTGNNHANLIEYNGRYYIFYHQGYPDFGNHRRQVWAKEIALINNPPDDPDFSLPPDGEIVGVTRPPIADMEKLELYGSLNGTSTSIEKSTRYLRSAVSRNALTDETPWSYVTLSLDATYNDGVGIYERALRKHSQNQEWIIEDIKGTNVGGVTLGDGAVRIRNSLTPDKVMTCGAEYGSPTEQTANYGLFNYKLDTTSQKQVWIKEKATNGPPGSFRLMSLWNNGNANNKFYLTRSTTPGDSHTFCKLPLSNTVQRQMWFIE
jgi:hypothetical protein